MENLQRQLEVFPYATKQKSKGCPLSDDDDDEEETNSVEESKNSFAVPISYDLCGLSQERRRNDDDTDDETFVSSSSPPSYNTGGYDFLRANEWDEQMALRIVTSGKEGFRETRDAKGIAAGPNIRPKAFAHVKSTRMVHNGVSFSSKWNEMENFISSCGLAAPCVIEVSKNFDFLPKTVLLKSNRSLDRDSAVESYKTDAKMRVRLRTRKEMRMDSTGHLRVHCVTEVSDVPTNAANGRSLTPLVCAPDSPLMDDGVMEDFASSLRDDPLNPYS